MVISSYVPAKVVSYEWPRVLTASRNAARLIGCKVKDLWVVLCTNKNCLFLMIWSKFKLCNRRLIQETHWQNLFTQVWLAGLLK
nr:hypothetical protein [Tanacetum cinerariifolium]